MPITINGSGTVTGISAGGLPDGVITTDDLAANAVTTAKLGSNEASGLCKAWVNFDGTSNTPNLSGTYSQSGTTVTVTATAHGLIAGSVIYADATSGTAVDGTYTVATVTDANTFTYTAGTSLTTSGNITLRRNAIRASYNVSSVTDNNTGDFIVNFTTAMPDANYAVAATGRRSGDPRAVVTIGSTQNVYSTSAVQVVAYNDIWGQVDFTTVNVAVFR